MASGTFLRISNPSNERVLRINLAKLAPAFEEGLRALLENGLLGDPEPRLSLREAVELGGEFRSQQSLNLSNARAVPSSENSKVFPLP